MLRQADSSRDFSGLRSATEAAQASDFAYGVWGKTVNTYYAPATQTQLNTALATVPAFNGYGYAPAAENGPLKVSPVNGYGAPIASPTYTLINLPGYAGWTGKNFGYLASVRLTGTTNGGRTIKYGAKRAINYSVVPLFQATAFFEDKLELYKTATMTIGGLVHTNSDAYVSSSSVSNPTLTFTGNSYAGNYVDDAAPPLADLWSGYTPNSAFPPSYPNGITASVHEVNRMEPLGTDPASVLHPPVDGSGQPTGDLNPNDDTMRELIEPPAPPPPSGTPYPDPTPISQRRLYNKAGIIIKVTGNTYTVTTQNGASLSSKQVTALKGSLSQQTIYDRREGKWVDVTTLDVDKAKTKITGGGPPEAGPLEDSTFNNILYIYDDDSTYSDPKAVRLTNGDVLPSGGLTVASENPVYIQGDYNVGKTSDHSDRVPSAVFGDAVTILSNNWNDSNSSSSLSSRQASNTTVNTAIVAGFLPGMGK